jgi:DNA-binding NarL/FixJ family response regulator
MMNTPTTISDPLKLLIVAPPEQMRSGLLSLLYMVASVVILGQLGSVGEIPVSWSHQAPEILLVAAHDAAHIDYGQLAEVHRQQPALSIVIMAARHHRGVLDRLYRAGVRAFVTEDVGIPALIETLHLVRWQPELFLVRIGR